MSFFSSLFFQFFSGWLWLCLPIWSILTSLCSTVCCVFWSFTDTGSTHRLLLELFELINNSDQLGLTGESPQCLISSIHSPPRPQHSDVAMVKNKYEHIALYCGSWSVWSSLWSPAGLMSTLMHRSHPSGLIHCALRHRGVNGAAAECPCLQFTAIWGRPRSLPQCDKD